jgi:hypothetical protein
VIVGGESDFSGLPALVELEDDFSESFLIYRPTLNLKARMTVSIQILFSGSL